MPNLFRATVLASLLFSVSAFAVPTIPDGGVVNNASFLAVGLPGDGIARGSMFAVFGTELGPEQFTGAPSLPLGTTLGGTSISVTVNSVTRAAFMLFSAVGQLSAVLPSDVPAGNGTLTVTYDGMSSAPTAIKVVDSAFGIFSRNQAGFGPAILQNYVSEVEQPVNAITDAAHPGQVVILWGTGLGPIVGDDSNIPPVGNLPVTVEVWVGGKAAAVQYAGRSSQFPAIDQINFAIPAGVTGCYVPVVVVVNGVVSNYVTIAITDSGPYCSDFQTFLPGELETFVQDGEGGFGFAEMARYRGIITTSGGSLNVIVDDFRAEFYRMTMAELVKMTPAREGTAPLGACISNRFRAIEGANNDPVSRVVLGAGPELQLQGPQGMKSIAQEGQLYEGSVGGGFGDDMLPEFYTPGAYLLKGGSPGADIGTFEASISLPQIPQWTNQSEFDAINRNKQDLTFTWSGVDPGTEYVVISLQSINFDDGVAGFIFCSVDPAADSFTVPQRDLGTLPDSSPWDGDGDPTGVASIRAVSRSSAGQIMATGLVGGRFFYSNRAVRTTVIE